MKSYIATLVCLFVCVAYATAWGHHGGQFMAPWTMPTMVKVNATSIWIEKPEAGKLPKIGPSTSSNKEGLNLKDFCEYVLTNKDLPWGLSNLTNQVQTFTDPWGNVRTFNRPQFPTVDQVTNYCTNLKANDYTFLMPERNPNRYRRDAPEEPTVPQETANKQKVPGL